MQTSLKLNSLIKPLFIHKRNTLILFTALGVILGGCTSDLEDERFELIPGKFPKLVDVPDRPIHPEMSTFDEIQQKLLKEREMAYKAKEKNFEQLKK